MKKPNYELLKDAYAIIGGIPETAIDTEKVVTRRGRSLECGTIACAAGWLSMHPYFKAAGLRFVNHSVWGGNLHFGNTHNFFPALGALFGISRDDAELLFSHRRRGEADRAVSDKQLWLDRVRNYLARKGQL